MIFSVVALQRWLLTVAGLRALSGRTRRVCVRACISAENTLPQIAGTQQAPLSLLPAVFIGIFKPDNFKRTVIDRKPELGE